MYRRVGYIPLLYPSDGLPPSSNSLVIASYNVYAEALYFKAFSDNNSTVPISMMAALPSTIF